MVGWIRGGSDRGTEDIGNRRSNNLTSENKTKTECFLIPHSTVSFPCWIVRVVGKVNNHTSQAQIPILSLDLTS